MLPDLRVKVRRGRKVTVNVTGDQLVHLSHAHLHESNKDTPNQVTLRLELEDDSDSDTVASPSPRAENEPRGQNELSRKQKACPTCNEDTPSMRVLGKTTYVGHKRFLKKPHKWRRSLEFNGETENEDPPREFSRDAIMTQLARCAPHGEVKHPSLKTPQVNTRFEKPGHSNRHELGQEQKREVLEATRQLTLSDPYSAAALFGGVTDDMMKVESQFVDILCNFEKIYPPAFFDIMIHLVIHLPQEALKGRHIPYRWMYPFKRYMKKLKNYVRNKAKPEGSIVEGYVAEEALTFNSHYFRDVLTKFNHSDHNVDCPPPTCQFQVFRSICRSIGKWWVIRLDHQELKKVIWYVPHNSLEIHTYLAKFKSEFPNQDMKEEFPGWFGTQIRQCYIDKDPSISDELFALACGPNSTPISVNSCVVSSVRFVVHSRDERRTTQTAVFVHLAPTNIIDVDEDDDFIDDKDDVPLDLADSDDEVLANDDDDDVDIMSATVARGHGGDGGGDDPSRPPQRLIRTGCRGVGGRKPNRGGRAAGRLGTRDETRNLGLNKIVDEWGSLKIRFEWNDRSTMLHLGEHAAQWSNLVGEIVREFLMYYPSWHKIKEEKKARVLGKLMQHFDLTPHIRFKLWPKIKKGIDQHMAKASDPDLPRTSSRRSGIRRLTIGLVISTLPERFKMLKTGQRARSSTDRDPGYLLSSEINRWRAPRLVSTRPLSRPSSTHILMAVNLCRTRREFN
ncbi:DIE2/ALG10 family protein, partial [Tanacetum coccineum]